MKKVELRKVKQNEFFKLSENEKYMYADITSAAAKDLKRICTMM